MRVFSSLFSQGSSICWKLKGKRVTFPREYLLGKGEDIGLRLRGEEVDELGALGLAAIVRVVIEEVLVELVSGDLAVAVGVEALEGISRRKVVDVAQVLAKVLEVALASAHREQQFSKCLCSFVFHSLQAKSG